MMTTIGNVYNVLDFSIDDTPSVTIKQTSQGTWPIIKDTYPVVVVTKGTRRRYYIIVREEVFDYLSSIIEILRANPKGLSREMIKRAVETEAGDAYDSQMVNLHLKIGLHDGTFVAPKGPSGRILLRS
jgi:hypothetical protein